MRFYKSFKPTKRLYISFEKFTKNTKLAYPPYNNGIAIMRDSINGLTFKSLTLGTFRATLVITDKNPMGHCSS